MKLTPKQEELLQLLRDGWTVYPSEYRGRFGTTGAYASKTDADGFGVPAPRITQHTIDALEKRGLVKRAGPMHRRVIVLAESK